MMEEKEYIYHNGMAYASDKDEKKQLRNEKKSSGGCKFIIMQSAVCILVIAAVLLLKSFKADVYAIVKAWYTDTVNKSVLIDYDGADIKREILDIFGSDK